MGGEEGGLSDPGVHGPGAPTLQYNNALNCNGVVLKIALFRGNLGGILDTGEIILRLSKISTKIQQLEISRCNLKLWF